MTLLRVMIYAMLVTYKHKNHTIFSKSVYQLSTGCVRTVCPKLSNLEQLIRASVAQSSRQGSFASEVVL